MLSRAQRRELAETLIARIVATDPEVILAGVYGSAANGTDTDWSDLDLLVVTRTKEKKFPRRFSFRDTSVAISVTTPEHLEDILTSDPWSWEWWMGTLSTLHLLHGPQEHVEEWLTLGRSVTDEVFQESIEACLPWLLVANRGKIISSCERGERHELNLAVYALLQEIKVVVCLVNRAWTSHGGFKGILDTLALQDVPEGYASGIEALLSASTPDDHVNATDALVDSFWSWLERAGYTRVRYDDYRGLPI